MKAPELQQYIEPEDAERYYILTINSLGQAQIYGNARRGAYKSERSANLMARRIEEWTGRETTVLPVHGAAIEGQGRW